MAFKILLFFKRKRMRVPLSSFRFPCDLLFLWGSDSLEVPIPLRSRFPYDFDSFKLPIPLKFWFLWGSDSLETPTPLRSRFPSPSSMFYWIFNFVTEGNISANADRSRRTCMAIGHRLRPQVKVYMNGILQPFHDRKRLRTSEHSAESVEIRNLADSINCTVEREDICERKNRWGKRKNRL